MALAKAYGTRIRDGRYLLNIAVPVELRALYSGKDGRTNALGTANPRAAANPMTTAKAKLIEQKERPSDSCGPVCID